MHSIHVSCTYDNICNDYAKVEGNTIRIHIPLNRDFMLDSDTKNVIWDINFVVLNE